MMTLKTTMLTVPKVIYPSSLLFRNDHHSPQQRTKNILNRQLDDKKTAKETRDN